ncbi:MAG: T9SS type A sorting domain-containing protein [Bacteroidetes bacterium]|nr:T9SS type A sorting domain-containing protein [Bacteroidota bacterium]
MSIKSYIFVFLLLFISVEVAQAQPLAPPTLYYHYSPTGNRMVCYVGYAKIAVNPDEQEEYTETLDSIKFNIYPNPTKGLLKVTINTEVKIDDLKIELYDINGKKFIEKSVISTEIELDITDAYKGNYLMKVFVNDKPYYWNILKE